MASIVRFSPSRGWDQVRAWLSQHMNVLVAIGGAFFLLPLLVVEFLGPGFVAPVIDPNGTDPQVAIDAFAAAFRPLIPWMIALALVQMVGQLSIMAIAAARQGIGVSEAIGIGFSRFPWLILVNIVLGIGFGIAFVLLGVVAGMLGMAAAFLALLFGIAIAVLLVYLSMRLSLVGALIVTENRRSPFDLIARSWTLTSGNAGTIFLFFLLVSVVYLVVIVVASVVFGLIGLAFGPSGAAVAAVLNGIVSTAGTIIFSMMPVAVWRQLAGEAATTPEVFS